MPNCSRSNRPSDNTYYQERMYHFANVIVGIPKDLSKAHPTPFAIRRELIRIFWLDCISTQPEISGIGEQYRSRGEISELENSTSVADSSEYSRSARAESSTSDFAFWLRGNGDVPSQYRNLCSQLYGRCEQDDTDISQTNGSNEVLGMEMGQQNGDANSGDAFDDPQARSDGRSSASANFPKASMQSLILDEREALKVNSVRRTWESLDHNRIYITRIVPIEDLRQKQCKSYDRLWSWSREEDESVVEREVPVSSYQLG